MRCLFYTCCILFLVNPAIAGSTTTITSTPFQNIILNPNNTIVANYTFGTEPIIFCFTNTLETLGNVTWTYKGNSYSGSMPLYLKTNGNYQGAFADSTGTINITNTTTTTMIVSCMYAL